LKLPLFTVIGLSVFLLMDAVIQPGLRQWAGAVRGDVSWLFLNFLVLTLVVCSLVMGDMIAKFDLSQPGNELPVFIAIRPMTNGGFVLAKLAMAAVSSMVACLAVAAAVAAWLILGGHAPLLWHAIQSKPAAFPGTLLASFLLLVLLTWRNLIAGIWVGLTARPGFIAAVNCIRYPAYLGIALVISRAKELPEFRAALFHWLPWILSAGLVVKLLSSAVAFHFGLRRNALTRGAICWILGGWLACGLFVAVFAKGLCNQIAAPQLWVWVAVAGFYLLPLAELSLAPLALAWNRHQ
jgi:hypothetical protein